MFTPQSQPSSSAQGGIERHLAQMVAFASLDSVDELLEGTGNLYVCLILFDIYSSRVQD
jgi:hypothetical protein